MSFQLTTILMGILYSGSSDSHGIFGILPTEAHPLAETIVRQNKLIAMVKRRIMVFLLLSSQWH
ncbi:hypothetical protein DTL21_23660 [Bremerella cremea]|nr:hypothetical protein DTL21_23660 [Bremerella cremea]